MQSPFIVVPNQFEFKSDNIGFRMKRSPCLLASVVKALLRTLRVFAVRSVLPLQHDLAHDLVVFGESVGLCHFTHGKNAVNDRLYFSRGNPRHRFALE